MSGPRAVNELLEVWLRGLPLHESRALGDLTVALGLAKLKAQQLPPSIDRRCADLVNTKLDEAEHWMLSALRAAVDRNDDGCDLRMRCTRCGACTCPACARARGASCCCPTETPDD